MIASAGAETLDPADVADEARVKAGQQWLAKHDKECARQEGLLYCKALEAATKNQLLIHEISEDIQENAALLEEAENHNRAARDRLEDKMQARLARPEFNPYGKTVHCEHGLFQDADFNRLLLQHHMRAPRGDAPVDVFVVADLARPCPALACLAGMHGSLLASPQFFKSGGSVGSAIAYTKALQTRRFLFVSQQPPRDFCFASQGGTRRRLQLEVSGYFGRLVAKSGSAPQAGPHILGPAL